MDYQQTGQDERVDTVEAEGFEICLNDRLTDDALGMAKAALRPASDRSVRFWIGRLAVHKRIAKLGKSGMDVIFADSVRHLGHLPEYALILAVDEIVAKHESEWFPQIATLVRLVERKASELEAIYHAIFDRLNQQPRIESPAAMAERHMAEEQRQREEATFLRSNWKRTPREDWTAEDWDFYIADVQQVVDALRAADQADMLPRWQAMLDERIAEREQELRTC